MNKSIVKKYKSDNIPYLKLYKGNYFTNNRPKKRGRVVVFDLDETLGSFQEFHTLWTALQGFQKSHDPFPFNSVLDLYPEFVRTHIYPILEYVYLQKTNNTCKGIYLYTKNKNSIIWIQLMCKYFQYKINALNDFFDKIIYAFKMNNNEICVLNNGVTKTHSDLIKCVMLPSTTEICFIDNTYFSKMDHTYVYYIQPSSYHHTLSSNDIIHRFIVSKLLDSWDNVKKDMLNTYLQFHFLHNDSVLPIVYRIDKEAWDKKVAGKIMYHVKEFFYLQQMSKNTRKKKQSLNLRFTRKSY